MFPSTRLVGLCGFGALLLGLGAWEPRWLAVGAACNLGLVAAVALDYQLARRRGQPVTVARESPEPLSLGAANLVSVRLRNCGAGRVRVLVRDRPPCELAHDCQPVSALLSPGEEVVARYRVTPRRKGDFEFGATGVRVWSPLGLLVAQELAPTQRRARVYPNLQAVRRWELLARRGRLQETGLRTTRYRGRGTEFESLRPYQPDDDSRHINWKATARRRQIITSQFEAERSQQVLLVLDAGRMMAGRLGEMTKLDFAINAALMSGYVAAAMGDRVGLLAFAQGVRCWLPPRRGRGQVFRLLEALYRLEPELVEPDYEAAFGYLALRQRRRSLVIVFTDLLDPDSSGALLRQLRALHPHHLVLCATLADAEVVGLARATPEETPQVYRKAVALQVLSDREAALAFLRQRGIQVVDAPADRLTPETINRYLQLKARSLL